MEKIKDENQRKWAEEVQALMLKLLDHPVVFSDILSKVAVPDLIENYRDYFRQNGQLTEEENSELWEDEDTNRRMKWAKINKLIIQNKDNHEVVNDLYCYVESSVDIMKEYIRQVYPNHYRVIFNKDPHESKLSPKELKKSNHNMKRSGWEI